MEKSVSYGISVNFEPWTSVGLCINSLRLHEELGGNLAVGSAELITLNENISFEIMLRQYSGYLEVMKEGVGIIKIDFFVTNRRFHRNALFLDFVCVKDRRFFTDLKSLEYTDITQTLNSIYPGKTDIRCESDINNEIPLRQFMETDLSFCTKLALSFKKNIVFGFGWESFLIKDLKDGISSRGKKEEYNPDNKMIENAILLGGSSAEDLDYLNVSYDSMRFVKPSDPWEKSDEGSSVDYSEYTPLNSRTLKYYDRYITLGKDYYGLVENYLYNKELLRSNLFASKNIRINDIPNFKLGDVITYKHLDELETDIPYKTYLVKSNTLSILLGNGLKFKTGSGIKWDTELVSLVDSFGELLPESDITEKIYEG